MKMKIPQFFLLTLTILTLTFQVQANIFDEDDQNNIDQNSLNQLSSELQEMEENKTLTQIYLPTLPEPNKNEWSEESKIAQDSEENTDEVKRKEAAIMRDLEEHAKPLEGITPSPPAPLSEETKPEKKEEQLTFQKEAPEFKPRVRGR